jgi:hypothetical protein
MPCYSHGLAISAASIDGLHTPAAACSSRPFSHLPILLVSMASWRVLVCLLLVGYLLAPQGVWHLCQATHAAAEAPPTDNSSLNRQ